MKKYFSFLLISFLLTSAKSQSLFETVYELKQDPIGALTGKGNIIYFMHGSWLKIADMTVQPLTILDSIQINEQVKQLLVSDNRLFILSNSLMIYNIADTVKPIFVSTFDLPDVCNSVSVVKSKIYLATIDGILTGDLTTEQNVSFTKSFKGNKLLWIEASDSLLITQTISMMYGFKIHNNATPVLVDSMIAFAYSIPDRVLYQDKIFIPAINKGIFVYEFSEDNKFVLTDTIKVTHSIQLFRTNDFLFSREQGVIGFGITVIGLKNWPNYTAYGSMYQLNFWMSKFYGDSNHLVMSGDADGLMIYSNENNGSFSLTEHDYLSFRATESALFKNHLFLNSTDGYRIYNYDENFKLSLVKGHDEPPTDYGRYPDFHFEFYKDTVYSDRVYSVEYFDINNLQESKSFSYIQFYSFGGISISGNFLWTFSGNEFVSSIGHGFNLLNLTSQTEITDKIFYHGEDSHAIETDSSRIYLSSDNGITIYSINGGSYCPQIQTISTGGVPHYLLKYDSLLICQNQNQNIIILKEQPDGKFKIISTIPIETDYYNSRFNVIDNYLIVPYNSKFYVYDLLDPNNPQFIETLPSYGNSPTAVGVDGDLMVIANGSRGFSLLKYKGRPTSIAESNNSRNYQFTLHQNYPNPFNPTTEIRYQLSATSDVKLIVYDVLGREVQTLVSENQKAGDYRVHFDAKNLASGIYFTTLTSKNGVKSIRMTVLK